STSTTDPATDVPTWSTDKKIDGADVFDGSNDYVDLGESQWDGDPSGKTFTFWFQRKGAATVGTAGVEFVLGKGAGHIYGYGFGVNESDQVFVAHTNGTNAASSLIVVDDTWYHVAVVASGGNFTFYIDGSPDTTVAYTYAGDNDMEFSIGRGGQCFFNGIIDEVRISSTIRSADWIKTEHSNMNAPGSFYTYVSGNEESGLPTAARLISFTATGQDSSVLVAWETAQEVSNVGFNVYRLPANGGSPVQLNSDLIPGLISSVKGQKYTFTDTDVTRGELYYYLLEDVDLAGRGTINGPVCVDWDGDGVPDDFYDPPYDKTSDSDTDIEEGHPENGIPVDLPDMSGSIDTVKIASFTASQQDGGVVLKWQTGYELDILGFHVYREIDSQLYRITPNMVPGSVFKVGAGKELPEGQSYVFWDALPELTGRELYWLECTDTYGARAYFGPAKPGAEDEQPPERLRKRFLTIAELQHSKTKEYWRIRRLRNQLRARPMQEDKRKSYFRKIIPSKRFEPRLPPDEEQYVLSAKTAVKISIKEEGWYSVGQPELVAAGLDSGVDPRSLQLYAEGKEHAIMVTGSQDGWFDAEDAIEFYGTGLDTPYTGTRVYWLVAGSRSGKRIQVARSRGRQEAPSSFPYTVEVKERLFFFAALKNGEEESFFGSVVSTDPVDQLITVPHVAPSAPEDALLEVVLQGATDFSHHIKILLNEGEIGEVFFDGQEKGIIEITISQDMLLEGDNIVTLAAQGGALDVSVVDYIRLTYWRTHTADQGTLRLTAMGGEQLSISGFGSSGIRVVDITHPDNVFKVKGKVIAQGSGYTITVSVPGSGERTLLAFAEETVKEAAGLALNLASDWQNRAQGADFVIIAHSDFIQSAQSLKELRELQGLLVELVDVEDLYDEFNYGAKSPWALRDFLARAYDNWSPQPRFVLFVGEASFDPRDYLGLGGLDLVPTKLVDTDFIKTASDDWFIDFNDDGLPEMAAGRLPVHSVAEAETIVGKIIAYEDVAGTMNDVLLVADASDIFDYETATVGVAELLPAYMVVSQIFRGQSASARSDLLNSLNQGQLVVNYIGHGSAETWRGNLFSSSDAMGLTNSPYLPFFIGMTCLNGYFHDYYDNLAEALMKAEQGGALAVWTSSGLTDAFEQVIMNQSLIQLLFGGEDLTLGEATMRAKAAVGDKDVRRTWILFGDPTSKIR
ncbi:MAG: C25 family cysteine peptidase, partial [Candidatus Aminicenantaceae bacterium]